MTLLLGSTLRVSLIVLLALLATAILRKRSAAVRHWILAAGIGAALIMPAMAPLAPRWTLPLESFRPGRVIVAPGANVGVVPPAGATPDRRRLPPNQPRTRDEREGGIEGGLAVAWAAGFAIGLAILVVALVRLSRLASRCEPMTARPWLDQLHELSAQFGSTRSVTLLQSSHPSLLVTWGIWRPKIVLPITASEWPTDRIRVVLSHELSHIRRADWAMQLAAGILRAVYWFNPLLWIACSRLRHESEHACDDDVLSLGVTGPDYATHLLNVARAVQHRAWVPALGMARPSSLQRRVSAMLNRKIDRSPLPVYLRVVIAGAALTIALVIAGSGAAAQGGAPLSGSFVDALDNGVPGVALTLTNSQTGEQYTVRSDADGRFAFDGLPDGDYRGQANAMGFAETHPFFKIVGGKSSAPKVTAVIPLPLASVQEEITVSSVVTPRPAPAAPAGAQSGRPIRDLNASIAPPLKTRDVHPVFPPNRTNDEGTVFLEGIIDTNGQMKGLQVLQPADPDFASAATTAVNQWQFAATLLHGVPVDTAVRITVRFVH